MKMVKGDHVWCFHFNYLCRYVFLEEPKALAITKLDNFRGSTFTLEQATFLIDEGYYHLPGLYLTLDKVEIAQH